ncbi:hypothetical protein GDO81_007990 [Engystomops pustulosus]|uniref:Uncharacterized protein n=1 Tax=Engystomops pustulosus TaxID=76066 RepID=A0AAV7CB96_ENGPU|nr:hypothetical protein GDO81_007990 [Engystomops pustulosus]
MKFKHLVTARFNNGGYYRTPCEWSEGLESKVLKLTVGLQGMRQFFNENISKTRGTYFRLTNTHTHY